MKTEKTGTSWEDVVFEFRNKAYGAYPIRKSYNKNISKASLITFLIAAFVFGVLQIASLMRLEIKLVPPRWGGKTLEILPLIKPDQSRQKVMPQSNQRINRELQARVVTHEVVDTPPVIPPDAGQTEDEGTGTGVDMPASGTGTNAPELVTVAEVPPAIFDHPEVMPEYEGGLRAMIQFISRNIHYPAAARATGLEGTVFVRFVVNNLGQVVDVEVVKGVNAVLDKEAMRVIALMKKWKPGSQNNVPVNVRMVLPIKFQLENE